MDAMPPADADLARSLRLLGLAAFASMASMRWCDALLPALADEFSTTAGQSAQVVYAFTIAYGVMQLIYGPLGDRLRSEEHTSELQSRENLVCRLPPEKKKRTDY